MTAPPTVLVADDQPAILDALAWLLMSAGYEVETANSIERVRERLDSGNCDLLLMDLNYGRGIVSGGEGLDFLSEVRSRDRAVPIVVMTGCGTIDTAVEAMRRGASSFVQKPWDNRTIVEIVRRELDAGVARRNAEARFEREQADARAIQRRLLPTSMPGLKGGECAGLWKPASGVGGDCYDVLAFSDSRVGLVIADVIGKGIPAALLMSNLQAAVRAFADEASPPKQVAARVNHLLCRNVAVGKFASVCYAFIDLAAGTVVYSNAGHNPPILARADGSIARLEPTGMVMGVAADAPYGQKEVALTPGDRLVFFTDGITEATNPDGEDFGDARLIESILRHRRRSAQQLLASAFADVTTFAAGPCQDDATLIALSVG